MEEGGRKNLEVIHEEMSRNEKRDIHHKLKVRGGGRIQHNLLEEGRRGRLHRRSQEAKTDRRKLKD